MNNTNSNHANIVSVFLGDPEPADRFETRAVRRLVRSLTEAGIPAVIFFDFVAQARRQHRQVDLLIVTAHRVVHAELKNLDPDLPLTGSVNGRWYQTAMDGSRRYLDQNPYRQAEGTTYALSDAMREAADAGLVPAVDDGFFRRIDTVVCVAPSVPAHSHFGRHPHVSVVGLDQLVGRLAEDGVRPPWNNDDWETFARHLGVCREAPPTTPAQRHHRRQEEIVADYRAAFRAAGAHLGPLVPLTGHHVVVEEQAVAAGASGPAVGDPAVVAARLAGSGQTVVLTGPSGAGKTHAARHASGVLTDEGQLVVWARAGEYEPGRFGHLLARATAPYSAEHTGTLLEAARATGTPVVVVVDGYNECPEPLRAQLAEQATAFRRRHPGGSIVTSTVAPATAGPVEPVVVAVATPDPAQRAALLAAHGACRPELVSSAFSTPFQLSVAAACEAALGQAATEVDLFDAYVRRLVPAETDRASLRTFASALDAAVRTSLPHGEVVAGLAAAGVDPARIDAALGGPLVEIARGRCRFTHELLGRYLAAEALTRAADDGAALGAALRAPEHHDLWRFCIASEPDPSRRAEALAAIADANLYAAALTGGLGATVAADTRAAANALMVEAAFATEVGCAHLDGDFPTASWQGRRQWNPAEQALLAAVGTALHHGLFADEVGMLCDRTDPLVLDAAWTRKEAGDTTPLSTAAAATYTQMGRHSDTPLAVSIVAAAAELHFSRQCSDGELVAAQRLVAGAGSAAYGRVALACHLLAHGSDTPVPAPFLTDLLSRAWQAGGYHLRLDALQMAECCARGLDDDGQGMLAELLETFEPDNWAHSSSIVEALSACGRITPIDAEATIRARIEGLLARSDDPAAWKEAAIVVTNQFENEDIVGPYTATIDALDPARKARLYVMAVRGEQLMWRGWTLRQLATMTPCGDRVVDGEIAAVLADAVRRPPEPAPGLQESVATHLAGVRGWAVLSDVLPPALAGGTADERAWRIIDQLLLHADRSAAGRNCTGDPDAWWSQLHHELPEAGPDVLFWLARSEWGEGTRYVTCHQLLLDTYPAEIRRLLEWGLVHRESLTSLLPPARRPGERDQYIVGTLGAVGDHDTAALLRGYLPDPDLGSVVVAALRRIDEAA